MRQHEVVINYGNNMLSDPSGTWNLPITYCNGHSFVHYVVNSVLFTRTEFEKLQLHFHHPSSGKLYNLLKMGRPR